MECRRAKPRHYVLLALALSVIGGAGLTALYFRAGGSVSRANYNSIRTGMTLAEVEAVLGGPGDKLGPLGYEDIHVDEQRVVILESPQPLSIRTWESETHKITVLIDGNGRVIGKSYSRPPGASVLRKVMD